MDLELAKKLLDHGFKPQRTLINRYFDEESGGFYIPTLTELIVACGNPAFSASFKENRWFVRFPDILDAGGNSDEYWLPTLEDVFVFLWLELNKKADGA